MATSPSQGRTGHTPRNGSRLLWAILVFAAVLRITAVLVRWESLDVDRPEEDLDGYVALAGRLAAGNGFVTPKSGEPTAYRPPLYPLLLAPLIAFGPAVAVATLHVLLGTLTVGLTHRLGRNLRLGRGSLLAAGLVAVDPLLLLYTTYPMTETTFTFLVTLLLLLVTAPAAGRRDPPNDDLRAAGIGFVFGLAALCRPTAWAFAALAAPAWLATRPRSRARWRRAAFVLLGTAVVVAPWGIRNTVVFGRPVLTTTHGGYTLLLANNPVFYEEVVQRPWGTVWDGESLAEWQDGLEARMAAEDPPVEGELARDRWMTRRALAHVRDQPGRFLHACWFRVRRFWNPAPLTVPDSLPDLVYWPVVTFNTLLLLAAAAGLVRLRGASRAWIAPLLLVASLTLVHALYWSNARMRAPLVPVLALLAARSVSRNR